MSWSSVRSSSRTRIGPELLVACPSARRAPAASCSGVMRPLGHQPVAEPPRTGSRLAAALDGGAAGRRRTPACAAGAGPGDGRGGRVRAASVAGSSSGRELRGAGRPTPAGGRIVRRRDRRRARARPRRRSGHLACVTRAWCRSPSGSRARRSPTGLASTIISKTWADLRQLAPLLGAESSRPSVWCTDVMPGSSRLRFPARAVRAPRPPSSGAASTPTRARPVRRLGEDGPDRAARLLGEEAHHAHRGPSSKMASRIVCSSTAETWMLSRTPWWNSIVELRLAEQRGHGGGRAERARGEGADRHGVERREAPAAEARSWPLRSIRSASDRARLLAGSCRRTAVDARRLVLVDDQRHEASSLAPPVPVRTR